MQLSMCIYVCMYVCMCIYIFDYTGMYVTVCTCIYVFYVHTSMCIYIYACILLLLITNNAEPYIYPASDCVSPPARIKQGFWISECRLYCVGCNTLGFRCWNLGFRAEESSQLRPSSCTTATARLVLAACRTSCEGTSATLYAMLTICVSGLCFNKFKV